MDYNAFIATLTKFADSPSSLDISRGKILCEIRDEVIDVGTRIKDGEILITENGEETTAVKWLLKRVARMPILADRILSAFNQPDHFICPNGSLLNQLDDTKAGDEPSYGHADALTIEIAGMRPAGCSNVIYLTSDAGEGKTTLITHMARSQAQKFKDKESDWLLVPISLGGKPFLRFDDLIVGFLGNQLRFPIFYYDAFMELVKLGVIVPAFDGFEEMFVQSPQGDALSAIGNLMHELNSCGTVLIAARKAYFEYQDIRTQARLFDSIGTRSVAFSKVQIERWNMQNFLAYADKRQIANGDAIYKKVSDRLGTSHPILTRAVLVKRLLDVASETKNLDSLLQQIGSSPNDYFSVFVSKIVEREATEKWINRVGEPHQQMISLNDHFELLSLVAQEMWTLSTDNLRADVLDLITELFCESRKLGAEITFQIKERTKQHALIVGSTGARNSFSFDHDEFKNYFLGIAIARACLSPLPSQRVELFTIFRRGTLPPQALEAALAEICKSVNHDKGQILTLLQEVFRMDGPMSFTQENIAKFIIRIMNGQNMKPVEFSEMTFGADVLRDLILQNITFLKCSFGPTSLENTTLANCNFLNCHFERIELFQSTKFNNTSMISCEVVCASTHDTKESIFDPPRISNLLRRVGVNVPEVIRPEMPVDEIDEDADLKLFRRLLRAFHSRTNLNEKVVLLKLGDGAEMFVKNEVPKLVKAKILDAEWTQRDKQYRYRLSTSMELLQETLRLSERTLDGFIQRIKATRS